MNGSDPDPASTTRRRVLAGAVAAVALRAVPLRAAAAGLPEIPELTIMLAGRTPKHERLVLEVPRIAEDGNTVPAKITLPGPFAPDAPLVKLALFSERNPVRTIIALDYPVPVARVELETRIRLAGTQQLVALAMLADQTIYVAVAEVEVAASACLDGS
jgi:sulfur-oxidizing protein SoxY